MDKPSIFKGVLGRILGITSLFGKNGVYPEK